MRAIPLISEVLMSVKKYSISRRRLAEVMKANTKIVVLSWQFLILHER